MTPYRRQSNAFFIGSLGILAWVAFILVCTGAMNMWKLVSSSMGFGGVF